MEGNHRSQVSNRNRLASQCEKVIASATTAFKLASIISTNNVKEKRRRQLKETIAFGKGRFRFTCTFGSALSLQPHLLPHDIGVVVDLSIFGSEIASENYVRALDEECTSGLSSGKPEQSALGGGLLGNVLKEFGRIPQGC